MSKSPLRRRCIGGVAGIGVLSVSGRVSERKPTRPLLRYHGGKWLLAEWITSRFPTHRVYVEAFGGAASVLLQKERSYAEIYNEIDGEIVNLFQVVRDNGDELIAQLELTPFSRTEFIKSYEQCTDSLEMARRTMVRSFMGFGSAAACGAKTGFRSNSIRSGTTPAHDWWNYPQCLKATIERLRGVVIENKDAMDVMATHDSEDTLHYVDPPYVLSTRSMANPYCKKGYRFEMTDEQHRELAAVLHSLNGMVVMSGYKSDLYSEIFADWKTEERSAMADGARPRLEVLWFNHAATTALSKSRRELF